MIHMDSRDLVQPSLGGGLNVNAGYLGCFVCVCVGGGGKLAQNLQINCGHSSSFLFLGKGLERSVHACARYSLQSSYNVIC